MSELKMHYKDCWIGRAHHDCTVRKVKYLQAELTDTCAARDALAQERDEARRMAGEQHEEALELNRVRHNLQHVLDQYENGARTLRDELAQAHAELAQRQESQAYTDGILRKTNDKLAEALTQAREELERLERVRRDAQDWRDEIQELWLDPETVEELRRQLSASERRVANWMENWQHCSRVREKQRKRLEKLATAEAALAECGVGGIRNEFTGLADAITQMAEYIGDPERCMQQEAERRARKVNAELARAREELTALDNTIDQLLERLDTAEDTLQAERQLRGEAEVELRNSRKTLTEAEQGYKALMRKYSTLEKRLAAAERCTEDTKALHPVLVGVHKALDKYQEDAYDDPTMNANARTRITRLGQRAERAEAELDETSRNLKRAVELNEWSRNELDRVNERADQAEAQTALVTPELAGLLERLAGNAEHLACEYHDLLVGETAEQDEQTARVLAARIREALALEARE